LFEVWTDIVQHYKHILWLSIRSRKVLDHVVGRLGVEQVQVHEDRDGAENVDGNAHLDS